MHAFDKDICLVRKAPFCFSTTIGFNWGTIGMANAKAGETIGARRYETGPPRLADPVDCVPIPPMPAYTLYNQKITGA
ncbi:MAG: hypothetical protein JEZ12_16270 [Desulfobacterium sp.]|nr:hypothetical protein [Desulfobacterium sp.]